MSGPLSLGLCQVADAVASGAISAELLVEASISACEGEGRALNAVVAVERDQALERARKLDLQRARGEPLGRLHGVPLAHKDMYYRAGRVSGCGSKIRADFVPATTSPLVAALEAAGSVTVARLHMSEFAMGPTGHNHHLGRCLNPHDREKITGGSSSGSGAAVGGRLVFGALGSDTGGSVRLPAALCGVAGLKPTQGLLSTEHMMGLSESLDCPGPLARHCRDIARLMDVMTGGDWEQQLGRPVKGLTLGLPTHYYNENVHPEVMAVLNQAMDRFRSLGVTLVDVALPDHDALSDLADAVWTPEAAALHLDWMRERPGDYGPQLLARLAQGLAISATAYVRARQLRVLKLEAMLKGPLAQCDGLLVPAVRRPTPTGAETDVGGGEAMRALLADISAFTRPLNYLGLPGLVVPAGQDGSGMPVAIQLIGRPAEDATLVRLGHAFERGVTA